MKEVKDSLESTWESTRTLQADPGSARDGVSAKQLLWILLLLFYLPMVYWHGWVEQAVSSVDFPSFYYAAKLAFNEHKTPYGFGPLDEFQPIMGRILPAYFYPPPSLLAFWPLTKLPLAEAYRLFTVVSHLCLLGSIWLLLTALMPHPRSQRVRQITIALCVIYFLSSDAVTVTFWLGQVNIMYLFLTCLALAAFRNGASSWRIALPLSMAIVLKAYPVFLLAPLLFRRRFRAVALTCLFIGIFTAISVLVLPPDTWSSYLKKVVPAGGYANPQTGSEVVWNQNINGLVTRLLAWNNNPNSPLKYPHLAKPAASLLALLAIAVTSFYSFRASQRDHSRESQDNEVAAFLLMIYMIAPLSWDNHLLYLFPVAVLVIDAIVTGATSGKVRAMFAAALFLMARPLPLKEPWLQNGWWSLLISVKFYAVLALWLFFLNRLRQNHAYSIPLSNMPESATLPSSAEASPA